MTVKDDTDVFGMSDADFANLSPSDLEGASAPSTTSEDGTDETKAEDDGLETKTAAELAAELEGEDDDDTLPSGSDAVVPSADGADGTKEEENPLNKPDAETGDKPKSSDKAKDGTKPAEPEKPTDEAKKPEDASDKSKPAPKAETEPKKVDTAPVPSSKERTPEQLATFFDQVMAPFKANGREIKLRTPEEAIQLMQLGAGYGRKMQEIQPALKSLRMLEKNNLLDENKLSFLIDLDKKNPEAIKKLIKDSGIDPLDINLEDNANYKPTNHSVTDNEVVFQSTLKELSQAPGGQETIRHINTEWDKESKDLLWNDPQIMTIIQEQRQSGIYAVITAEMDRQKMLGNIPVNTPFLKAYKIAGDTLVKQQGIPTNESEAKDQTNSKSPGTPAQEKFDQTANKALGTRTATPKPSATNGDKAKAAGSPKTTTKPAKPFVNPLNMPDDEFIREFKF